MLTIEVLGPGCAKCGRLEQSVREVANELHVEADIRKVTDLDAMIAHDVFVTPALVVNGRVVVAGRIPSRDEIRRFLGS